MKTLFVWDFHGTLEKGNVRAVQVLINLVMERHGLPQRITLEDTVKLYGLSWVDYFRFVYPEGTLEDWRAMKQDVGDIQIAEKIVEQYIEPVDHAAEVLEAIKRAGHVNLLLTNTAPEWVRHFTRIVKIDQYFDKFIGLDAHDTERHDDDIHTKKLNSIRQYIAHQRFNKIVKIGDRASDISVGQTLGAVTYFIRNQFNKDLQLGIKPDHEISDLRKILQEL